MTLLSLSLLLLHDLFNLFGWFGLGDNLMRSREGLGCGVGGNSFFLAFIYSLKDDFESDFECFYFSA